MAYNAETIAPTKHSTLGATATVGANAAAGGVSKGLKWGAKWIAGFTVAGAVLGLGIATGGLGFLASGFVLWPLAIGALGAAVGTWSSWIPGGAGAVIGGLERGSQKATQVKQENSAARVQEMQLEAYKYNAMANAAGSTVTNVNAPTASTYTGYPEQGSAMNAAAPQIGSIEYAGKLGQQREVEATAGR